MKIISSEDVLPQGWFLTTGPSYGIGWNNGKRRWFVGWRRSHGFRYLCELL